MSYRDIEHRRDLSPNRLRDLRSAVSRVAKFLTRRPRSHLWSTCRQSALSLPVINAAAVGLTPKTLNTPASLCERLRLCYKGRRGDT
jgi:hypothetical protein